MEELDQSSLHPLLEHLEANMCLGRESMGHLRCRRALKQRAIGTAYIFNVRNHYLWGDFTLLLSQGFSPRHIAPPSICVLSSMFIEDIYSQGLDSLFTDNPGTHNVTQAIMLGSPLWKNLTRVLSILTANMCLGRESIPSLLRSKRAPKGTQ